MPLWRDRRKFCCLYVSIMGLTRFYKTTVFLHLSTVGTTSSLSNWRWHIVNRHHNRPVASYGGGRAPQQWIVPLTSRWPGPQINNFAFHSFAQYPHHRHLVKLWLPCTTASLPACTASECYARAKAFCRHVFLPDWLLHLHTFDHNVVFRCHRSNCLFLSVKKWW